MNKKNQFFFDFLKKKKKFLRLGKNLDSSLIGVDFSDCLNFNSTQDQGFELNKSTIPTITQLVYASFCGFLEKTPDFNLENSKIRMYIYTRAKISNLDLFFVYRIQTKKRRTKREAWIKEYSQIKLHGKIDPRLCCRTKFLSLDEQNIQLDKKSLEERNKKLDSLCCFPKIILETTINSWGYLFNFDNPEVEKRFLETDLIFRITPFETVSTKKIDLLLAVNQCVSPDFPLCTDLYTELNLKNLTSFLNDSLTTCYRWQHLLIIDQPGFEHERCSDQVLYLTIESLD